MTIDVPTHLQRILELYPYIEELYPNYRAQIAKLSAGKKERLARGEPLETVLGPPSNGYLITLAAAERQVDDILRAGETPKRGYASSGEGNPKTAIRKKGTSSSGSSNDVNYHGNNGIR